jgi:serine/threonine protein kinase
MTGSAMAAPLVGGRYRLQHMLSSTVMAEVWLASDADLDREVVVKLLASGGERERFTREARAVAALSHPNIVHLFDFGDERDRPYMVFEHLAGGSLEERLQSGERLSNDEIASVAHEIAEGLAHAHERGVVHRDLKPGNVLFDREGRSKIADFGIARVQGRDTLTEAGTILGTAAYISPEQVKGEPATPASDVYSFGVMLYRLLAGRLPFEAPTPTKLAALHRDAEPPPLPPSPAGVRPLSALVMAALAKEPSRRPADGAALIGALDGQPVLEAGTTAILQPFAPLGALRRRSRRRWCPRRSLARQRTGLRAGSAGTPREDRDCGESAH